MSYTLCHITSRKVSKQDWFCDSLCRQVGSGEFPHVVFVDALLWGDNGSRRQEVRDAVNGRFVYDHVPPKPSVWLGPTRLTTQDYFAASNARNTGICYARGDYIMFIDDLSVMMPGFIDNVRHAAHHQYVVGGAYKKVFELVVEDGVAVSYREHAGGIDSRWGQGRDTGVVPIQGGQLYGCSCGFPMEALFKINGYDELCDSMGSEDYLAGIMLEKAGYKISYNRNIFTLESEELHGQLPVMKRVIKPGNPDQSWVLLNRVRADPKPRAYGNNFEIKELRSHILSGGAFPVPAEPKLHWFDQEPLSRM